MLSSVAKKLRSVGMVLGLLLAATTATLVSFTGAAFAVAAVNLAPVGPYNDSQSITVSGTGFPVRSALPTGLQIIECSDPGGLVANLPTDVLTACDGTTVNGNQINTDTSGAFSAAYSIVLLNSWNSNISCDASHYCVLWVGQDFNNAFLSGPHAFSTAFLISGNKSPQTVTFTSGAPSGATVGGPTYTASATASSGLPVSLTIDSSTSSVCSIATSVVTFLAVGTCTIDANQAGDGSFLAAPQMQQSFAVGAASATSTSTSTQVSAPTLTLGPTASVSDTATVQGSATNGSPPGTVNFYVCQTGATQALSPGPCAVAAGNHLSTGRVVAGANNSSSVASTPFTPTTAGTWCFSAVYTSMSSYSGSSDNTVATNLDPNECVLVTMASSATATFVSPAVVSLGPTGTVTDSVTVRGALVGGSPTGTVKFFVCQTSSSSALTSGPCPAIGTPEDPGESLVGGVGESSSATSNSFTPTAVGTWCFSAVYGGDANYGGSTDNTDSSNLDASECVLVTAAASTTSSSVSSGQVTLGASGILSDSVTVTGNATGGAPAGTVDFYVCGPVAASSLCTSTSTPEGAPALVARGPDAAGASSTAFIPKAVGVYCFAAVYVPASGGNYTGSSDNNSGTVDVNECATVVFAPFTITSGNSASGVAGQSLRFSVMTNGLPYPKIKKKGPLPKGVHLVDLHTGTATISGTPKKPGTYQLTIVATFGTGKGKKTAMQPFTLVIS